MLPSRLGKPPVVDAIFEIRFEPAIPSAGDLLPGMLYQMLGLKFSNVEQLPMASIPQELRENDPNLRHQSHHRMVGKGFRLDVGNRVATLAFGLPYPGWAGFRAAATEVLESVRKSNLTKRVERSAFRYVNLVPAGKENQLDLLETKLEILGKRVPEHGFQLRAEIPNGHFLSVVQIKAGATAKLPSGETREGILVDVDTLRPLAENEDFWTMRDQLLEEGHRIGKEAFFALLKKSTIESMDPEWGAANG